MLFLLLYLLFTAHLSRFLYKRRMRRGLVRVLYEGLVILSEHWITRIRIFYSNKVIYKDPIFIRQICFELSGWRGPGISPQELTIIFELRQNMYNAECGVLWLELSTPSQPQWGQVVWSKNWRPSPLPLTVHCTAVIGSPRLNNSPQAPQIKLIKVEITTYRAGAGLELYLYQFHVSIHFMTTFHLIIWFYPKWSLRARYWTDI